MTAGLVAGVTACSSGPAQSGLGPFSIGGCRMGYHYSWGSEDDFYTDQSAAQAGAQATFQASGDPNEFDLPSVDRSSLFTITLTATAVIQSFTVAYYDSSGKEIGTGTARLTGNGPNELTAGQKVSFLDPSATDGASSCQVIGSDSVNA